MAMGPAWCQTDMSVGTCFKCLCIIGGTLKIVILKEMRMGPCMFATAEVAPNALVGYEWRWGGMASVSCYQMPSSWHQGIQV
jgi:hypothetical protein